MVMIFDCATEARELGFHVAFLFTPKNPID